MRSLKSIVQQMKKMWNRQTLVFLFFLVLSSAFWLLQTFNEVYEQEIEVEIEVKDVPQGVVLTNEVPGSIKAVVRDRGVVLLGYKYGEKQPRLVVDATGFTRSEGRFRLAGSELVRAVRQQLSASTEIVSLRPDTLNIYYNRGRHKTVPVKIASAPTPANGFMLSSVKVSPAEVTVYGPSAYLDTLHAIFVSASDVRNVNAAAEMKLKTLNPYFGKTEPAEVKLSVEAERLVEKRVSVPVTSVNCPEGVSLRTFPTAVELVVLVGMSRYAKISADDFTIEADYLQVADGQLAECPLRVSRQPADAQHVRLTVDHAEYVIEKAKP